MSTCEFVDTFPAFLTYWAKAQDKPLSDQIESWATEYMAPLSLHFSIGKLAGTAHSVDNGVCKQTIVPEVSHA